MLPAGRGKPSRNLYGTEKLEVLFASLRGAYDVIIMDAPLAHPAANVAMLSRFADITLMVVRQGSVGYAGVAEAIENLNKFGADVDGLVFNGFEPSPFRYGHYANVSPAGKETRAQANPRHVQSDTFLFRHGSESERNCSETPRDVDRRGAWQMSNRVVAGRKRQVDTDTARAISFVAPGATMRSRTRFALSRTFCYRLATAWCRCVKEGSNIGLRHDG